MTPRRKMLMKRNLEEKLLKPELRAPMKMGKINLLKKTRNSPSLIKPGLSGCMKIGDLTVRLKVEECRVKNGGCRIKSEE